MVLGWWRGGPLRWLNATPFMALGTSIVLDAAPPGQSGAASAVSETGSELGGALGIAILGSIAASTYRADLAEQLPTGAPTTIPEGSLAEALSTAATLPDSVGAPLTDAAMSAFTQSIHVHAGAATGIVMVLAAVTGLLRRHVGASEYQIKENLDEY